MKKMLLTSHGLTTDIGRHLIKSELEKANKLRDKKIFLFHEPYFSIESMLISACEEIGFSRENIMLSGHRKSEKDVLEADYIYITEGNTFEILSILREKKVDELISKSFKEGKAECFIGASAGAIIAGKSIEEAYIYDRNFVRISDFTGLLLLNGIVFPHYSMGKLIKYTTEKSYLEKMNVYSVGDTELLHLEVDEKSGKVKGMSTRRFPVGNEDDNVRRGE